MYNRRYDKAFFMLRQESAGYGMGQRTPWGSCVLEVKNNTAQLQITIEGLRALRREEYRAYCILENDHKQEVIAMGTISPDGKGRCAFKYEFNPDSIGQTKQTAENIHTVAIVTDNKSQITAPLVASFGQKKDWKKIFANNMKWTVPTKAATFATPLKQTVIEEQPITLVAAESAVLEREESKIELGISATTGESYHGNFRGLVEKFRQELDELKDLGVFDQSDLERIKLSGEAKQAEFISEEIISEEPISQESISDEMKPTEETLENNKLLFLPNEDTPYDCISLEELLQTVGVPLAWRKELFLLVAMKKYQHFIRREEEFGYSVGIPASDGELEREIAMSLGFEKFQPIGDGKMGYWLREMK